MSKQRALPDSVLEPAILAAIATAIEPRELAPEHQARLRARILDRIKEDAPAPAGTFTVRVEQGEWVRIDPWVQVKILRRDRKHNNQTALWRLEPGAVIAGHPHAVEEECMVIEGEICIGGHVVRAGEMHVAQPGYDHPPLVSEPGALLLVRSEVYKQPEQG